MKSKFVIVGGGVVGASVAFHLTQRGARDVLILEREKVQGLGSTGKATGGIRAQFETEINIKLSLHSIEFFKNFPKRTGIDCGYEPRGYLFFATDETIFALLKKNVAFQKKQGLKSVEIVDKWHIADLVPRMNVDDILGGSFCATDGFINPLAVMEGFTKVACESGTRVVTNCEVLKIKTRNAKILGVETSKGFNDTKSVVVCAGAWAKRLANTAGIDLPVEPVKRQIVCARSDFDLPKNLPMVIDAATGFHFRPVSDSRNEILFACPDSDERFGLDTTFEDDFVKKIYVQAQKRASWLAETKVVPEKCRAGLYEMSPDHHAILGGCAVEGLYFANGFSGHGVMHAPATGRALAEIILDGKSKTLDVSSLSLERFQTGKEFTHSGMI